MSRCREYLQNNINGGEIRNDCNADAEQSVYVGARETAASGSGACALRVIGGLLVITGGLDLVHLPPFVGLDLFRDSIDLIEVIGAELLVLGPATETHL